MKTDSRKFVRSRIPGLKNLFFVLFPGERGSYADTEYTHPCIRIFRISEYHPEVCSPDSVIEFTGQNDNRHGFSLFNTYSMRAEINFSGYFQPALSLAILKALGKKTAPGQWPSDYYYPQSILSLARALMEIGMERRVLRDVRNERGRIERKCVPARFRNSAQLWFDAKVKGLELQRRTA